MAETESAGLLESPASPGSPPPGRERADALVLFGITGDLAEKMVLPALYGLVNQGFALGRVIGVTRSDWSVDRLRAHVRQAVSEHGTVDGAALDELLGLLRVARVDYTDPASFQSIAHEAEGRRVLAHYLALPPDLYEPAARCLAEAGLNENARLIVEKPFGHDLASARALQAELTKYFPDEAIRRVDHYLGKESVENLLTFRAANTMVDAILHRHYVRSVQLTAAESFDVADRGGFYDATGCLRDVVQNHLLQMLAYFVMDTPRSGSPEDVLAERTRALRAIRTVLPEDYLNGQYEGYRGTEGVAPDSDTETYAALRLYIDTDRWAGVPFALRAGKSLAASATEIAVEFARPVAGYHHTVCAQKAAPNLMRLHFEPHAGVTFQLLARRGADETVVDELTNTLRFPRLSRSRPYEHVLAGAVTGDPTRFSTMEAITECWRVVSDLLPAPFAPISYAPGTWGPPESVRLTSDDSWHVPLVP
ncbi:glucose-6-phosphate dehydrogenase [Actinocorallia aurea]